MPSQNSVLIPSSHSQNYDAEMVSVGLPIDLDGANSTPFGGPPVDHPNAPFIEHQQMNVGCYPVPGQQILHQNYPPHHMV